MTGDPKEELLQAFYSEFDMTRYAECHEMNIAEWFKALVLRHALNYQLENTTKGKDELADIINTLLFSPLRCHFSSDSDPDLGPALFSLLYSKNYRAVCDLQVMDLYDGRETIENHMQWLIPHFEEREKMFASNSFSTMHKELFESYHSKLLAGKIYPGSVRYGKASIDLDASDEDIKASFAIWLKNKREEMAAHNYSSSTEKSFTEKDCKEWAEKGVLPYIDLQIIFRIYKIRIPYHRIGKLIFFDEYDVDLAERVRKVTKPLADRLMGDNALNSMHVTTNIKRNQHTESNLLNVNYVGRSH